MSKYALAKLVSLLGAAVIISCSPSGISVSNNTPATATNVVAGAHPGATPAASGDRPAQGTVHQGTYTNPGFGFSLIIPTGYKGVGAPPGTPQHGIVIPLSPGGEAKLYIDGSYNALFLDSLEEMYKQQFVYLREDAQALKLEEKKATLLDGHPAIEFTAGYTDRQTGKIRITRQILSKRTCPGEDTEILYTINLDTTEDRFPEDTKVMEEVSESWRMLNKCG